MNFLIPAAFALAALIPIIIAMYLLKLRRTEQTVSSTYLWQRMVRDVEANAPWQRLRRNLLLLLQLLFNIFLILALARPFTWSNGPSGQAIIFIVDTSASMAATDETPSRLDAAKGEMRALVDGLPQSTRITIIAAGSSPQVLTASSQDRQQIYQAIDSIQTALGGSALAAARELASAIAARQQDAVIQIFSDFAGDEALSSGVNADAAINYTIMGDSDDNQAIGAVTLQTAPSGNGMTAFVQVVNYSKRPAQRRLVLSVDVASSAVGDANQRQTVSAYDLAIPPQDQQVIVADDLPLGIQVLQAELTGQDALALDERAWAVTQNAEPAPVTLVSQGNRFLETALALLPSLAVTTQRPADFEQGEGVPTARDDEGNASLVSELTIFDAYTPITATLPAGNLLFIAPARSTDFFTVTGTLEQPVLDATVDTMQLLANVALDDVHVLRAARMSRPVWARAIAIDGKSTDTAAAAPLLLAGEVDNRRIAVLAFDLRDSDLPLQVAFPVLLANLTQWLTLGNAGAIPSTITPSAPVTFALPPTVNAAIITRPDGSTVQLAPDGGRATFVDTAQLGVYQLAWDSALQARFAVNLFAPQESNVQPGVLSASAGGGKAESKEAESQQSRRDLRSRREWWRLLAFLALLLLVAEWLVYHRGTVRRLLKRRTSDSVLAPQPHNRP